MSVQAAARLPTTFAWIALFFSTLIRIAATKSSSRITAKNKVATVGAGIVLTRRTTTMNTCVKFAAAFWRTRKMKIIKRLVAPQALWFYARSLITACVVSIVYGVALQSILLLEIAVAELLAALILAIAALLTAKEIRVD
jgi:hypothetical protein